jgi:hypothetical protein
VFSKPFEPRGADLPFCSHRHRGKYLLKKFYYSNFMDSSSNFKAFGVILVHLEVDKTTQGAVVLAGKRGGLPLFN